MPQSYTRLTPGPPRGASLRDAATGSRYFAQEYCQSGGSSQQALGAVSTEAASGAGRQFVTSQPPRPSSRSWTALRYLEEWSGIAKAFDLATGYFEIGALLALDGKWQPLEKIRILMGAEMTYRTRKALLEAVRSRAMEILDGSIEADKETNPFLPRRSSMRSNRGRSSARGEIENRIKELHHGLAVYVLMQEIRLRLSRGSSARAQVSTIRDRFLKIGARVIESVRRIVVHLPASFPHVADWRKVALGLGAATG
jgi:DDE family transposase